MELEAARLHLKKDARLKPLIDSIEISAVEASRDLYYDLVLSIVYQQLSGKVAKAIFTRFCALFPDEYPHPELVVQLEMPVLRSAGLSGQKATYIQNIARFALEHDLELQVWNKMSDEDILQLLTQIKGVGVWTTQMILMFSLNRPDIFPTDDLGIQQAIRKLYQLEETGKPLKLKMLEIAENWRPYRTAACRYLWKYLDQSKTVK